MWMLQPDCAVSSRDDGAMAKVEGRPGRPSTHAVVYLPVFRSPPGVTRRAFLKTAVAGLALPASRGSRNRPRAKRSTTASSCRSRGRRAGAQLSRASRSGRRTWRRRRR